MDFLKSFFSASYKRTLTLIILLIILAVLPLAVIVSQQQQDIRQRAAPPDSSPTPTTAPPVSGPHSRVFVTSETYTGNLGGLTGGDAKCQALAESADLGGTWMAWLSDGNNSPSTRFVKSDIPYKLIDGTLVANNWNDLTSGTLRKPISKTESASIASGNEWVRTGTDTTGKTTDFHCAGWTNASGKGEYSTVGHAGTSNAWTSYSNLGSCDGQFHLYCFEQTAFGPTTTPAPTTTAPSPTIEQPTPTQGPTPTISSGSSPTNTPTPTQEPAPTINPNSIILTLPSFALEGFESGTPKDKDIAVYLYTPGNDPKDDIEGKKPTTRKVNGKIKHGSGKYSLASLDLGELPNGTKILLRIKKYLRVLVATQAESKNISAALTKDKFIIGDVDENNQIDIVDYHAIRNCFGQKLNTGACAFKETADLNEDSKVDGLDYNLFLKSLSFTSRQGD